MLTSGELGDCIIIGGGMITMLIAFVYMAVSSPDETYTEPVKTPTWKEIQHNKMMCKLQDEREERRIETYSWQNHDTKEGEW